MKNVLYKYSKNLFLFLILPLSTWSGKRYNWLEEKKKAKNDHLDSDTALKTKCAMRRINAQSPFLTSINNKKGKIIGMLNVMVYRQTNTQKKCTFFDDARGYRYPHN